MQEYVLGFVFDESFSNIILMRKKRPGWQAGMLNGVGGKIELGETPGAAMWREFDEETGISVSNFKQFASLCSRFIKGERAGAAIVYCFSGTVADVTEIRQPTDERVEVWNLDVLDHIGELIPNLRWIIPMAINSIISWDRDVRFHIDEH